jgi:hypothetical protein
VLATTTKHCNPLFSCCKLITIVTQTPLLACAPIQILSGCTVGKCYYHQEPGRKKVAKNCNHYFPPQKEAL